MVLDEVVARPELVRVHHVQQHPLPTRYVQVLLVELGRHGQEHLAALHLRYVTLVLQFLKYSNTKVMFLFINFINYILNLLRYVAQ